MPNSDLQVVRTRVHGSARSNERLRSHALDRLHGHTRSDVAPTVRDGRGPYEERPGGRVEYTFDGDEVGVHYSGTIAVRPPESVAGE